MPTPLLCHCPLVVNKVSTVCRLPLRGVGTVLVSLSWALSPYTGDAWVWVWVHTRRNPRVYRRVWVKVLIYIRGHGEYREGISSLVSRLDPRVYRNPLLQFFRANFAVCISNMKQNEMNGFCHICFFSVLFHM